LEVERAGEVRHVGQVDGGERGVLDVVELGHALDVEQAEAHQPRAALQHPPQAFGRGRRVGQRQLLQAARRDLAHLAQPQFVADRRHKVERQIVQPAQALNGALERIGVGVGVVVVVRHVGPQGLQQRRRGHESRQRQSGAEPQVVQVERQALEPRALEPHQLGRLALVRRAPVEPGQLRVAQVEPHRHRQRRLERALAPLQRPQLAQPRHRIAPLSLHPPLHADVIIIIITIGVVVIVVVVVVVVVVVEGEGDELEHELVEPRELGQLVERGKGHLRR
jgi:hypothetical protein